MATYDPKYSSPESDRQLDYFMRKRLADIADKIAIQRKGRQLYRMDYATVERARQILGLSMIYPASNRDENGKFITHEEEEKRYV